jgi:Xaa-Pro aminopeptidase
VKNAERTSWIRSHLHDSQIDALVCSLPCNVLMLTGYAPVIGTAVAVAFADGRVSLIVPEDEVDLVQHSWMVDAHAFAPGSLDKLEPASRALVKPLKELIRLQVARIGFENGEVSQPSLYSAVHFYSGSLSLLLAECFPHATLAPADAILTALRARKTPFEIERLRLAGRIAGEAFTKCAPSISVGTAEVAVAAAFRSSFATGLLRNTGVPCCDGYAWCMSGANSALAGRAYARSGPKTIARGDLVLMHANSHADGYWTDITRTYCAGEPHDRQRELFEAVFAAREAALQQIRPGASASAVDQAARDALRQRGLEAAFTHSTGHGVGFGAISGNASPRLHPASPDILETGMVFNVEPAVYFDGYGGIRHCDMVAVTASGYELLTPFHCRIEDLILPMEA